MQLCVCVCVIWLPHVHADEVEQGGRERVKRPVGEGDSRWHVHRGMLTYAATRVGTYLGEHTRPMRGSRGTRLRVQPPMLAKIGGCTCGREYRYTRLHVWPRILAKIRAGTE